MAEQTNEERIAYFCSVTGASTEEAIEHLSAVDWDTNLALSTFFQEEEADDNEHGPSTAPPDTYTGPRTLDGRPAPAAAAAAAAGSSSSTSAAASKKPQKKKGLMTMSSLMGSSRGHDHDDEDDEEDEEDEAHGRGDLFAGGEKSGLAVQDPNMGGPSSDAQKMIRDIIAKAKKNRPGETPADSPSQVPSRSWGAGRTVGSEDTPSRAVPDASGRPAGAAGGPRAGAAEETQERVLHIWQDGFSIDDGALHRFDDPSNAADLAMIRQGRAPLHLMNVQFGQSVDVKLHQHEENWHQLPRVYRPFAGEGRRLGSPVPGDTTAAAAVPAAAPASSVQTTPATTTQPAPSTVDESQPIIRVRVSLPDGTRLPARFNTTQTVGDVYDFVRQSMPTLASGRQWVLTTFPNKEHTDDTAVLGETDEFKRGAAVTVKWV